MKRVLSLGLMALMAGFVFIAPANAQGFNWNNGHGGYGYGAGYYNNGRGYGGGYNNGFRFHNRFNNQFNNRAGNIDKLQERLSDRITRGVSNGRLSESEAARLNNRMAKIAETEARMRASGNTLSARERQRLASQLTNLRQNIQRESRDFNNYRGGGLLNRLGSGGGFWR